LGLDELLFPHLINGGGPGTRLLVDFIVFYIGFQKLRSRFSILAQLAFAESHPVLGLLTPSRVG
jgi:hypothetical protein